MMTQEEVYMYANEIEGLKRANEQLEFQVNKFIEELEFESDVEDKLRNDVREREKELDELWATVLAKNAEIYVLGKQKQRATDQILGLVDLCYQHGLTNEQILEATQVQ